MSSPVSPSQIKAVIPKPGGNFCEKFLGVFTFPKLVSDIVAYMFNEDGTFTDEFKADVCNISCKCAGGVVIPGGGLAAPLVSASDGQYSDRVAITWNAISGATLYDVYRNTIDNSSSANAIATDLSSPAYEDTTAVSGQYYYYWVKARNPNTISTFSASDRGYAGSIATTLPAISDLAASQGFGELGGKISLVFSPIAGAATYDIYKNTSDDFGTATLIDSNRAPFDNSTSQSYGPSPIFVDNGGELVYFHDPGYPAANYWTPYFFWVVGKRGGPAVQSPQSNSAKGWVIGRVGVFANTTGFQGSNQTTTIPSGITKLSFALFGNGASGAGGNTSFGGGGGGGGPVLTGWINVVAGGKFRTASTPESDGVATASATSAANGSTMKLQYSANGLFSDTIDVATITAPGGGVWNGAGGGAGGAASTGTLHGSVQDPGNFLGRAGKAASGTKGGRSGTRFGNARWPGAHYNGFALGTSFGGAGQTKGAGSGSYASPTNAALATGGPGQRGFTIFAYYV